MSYNTTEHVLWNLGGNDLRETCDYCYDTFPVDQEELTEIDGYQCCTKCYNKIVHLLIK